MAPKAKPKAKARAEPKGRAASTKAEAKAKAKGRVAPKESPKKRGSSEALANATPKKRESSENLASTAAPAKKARTGGKHAVDRCVEGREKYSIYQDYTVKLNQTNIGGNNNKYYIIQVLEQGGKYFAWNRWGRVGEDGQNKLEPCGTNAAAAIDSFVKKFKAKTGNDWADKDSFVAKAGLYTLVEMEDEEDTGTGGSAPLGKLSKAQIEKGMDVLQKIDAAISSGKKDKLDALSSNFFSLIPTNFGRRRPEPIVTEGKLREHEELLKFWLRMGFEAVEKDDSLTPISGIMDLPVPKTLHEACSGVCAKKHLDSSTSKGEELAKKKAGKPVKVMGAALYASIMLYTSNAIYADLNKALREKNRAGIKKYFKYLRLLFEAMDCLPKKNSKLYRGLPVDLYDTYPVGSTQTWWNVSSCTADVQVAQNFMKASGGKCTLLTIEARTACDISDITFFANEKESLLAPGTQLKVKSSTRTGNLTAIVLTETGRVIN